ncbi:MAG: hypothetical protein NC299_09335 [Lachnospiraceae bacterium]|nr:hypothetical protein [Lachnospiraceae bacterium]
MDDCLKILKAAREAELEIQAETEHIERLHRILRLPHRTKEYAARMTEKLAALETELNASIDRACDRKREALECLNALSGNERTVLYRYYILGEDWLRISDAMYISERNVFNIRKKAMDKLRYPTGFSA